MTPTPVELAPVEEFDTDRPNYRTLRRGAAAVIAIIALTIIARWLWGRTAEARLDATIASLVARRVPIRPGDFRVASKPVPIDENAAVIFESAANAVRIPPELNIFYRHFSAEQTAVDGEQPALRTLISANANSIALARVAIALPEVDWGASTDPTTAVRGPFEIVQLPPLGTLAHILNDAALLHHDQHDDATAIECSLACLALSDAVAKGPATFETHHSASSIAESLARALLSFIKNLNLSATAAARVRLLTCRLCDERALRRCGIDAMYGQACWAIGRARGSEYTRGTVQLFRPMYLLDTDRLVSLEDVAAGGMASRSMAAATPFCPDDLPQPASILYTVSHVFSLNGRPLIKATIESHFEALQQRRLAAVALAARLFEVEHGRPPNSINELVPNYLPAVPVDAMSDKPLTLESIRSRRMK